MDDSSVPATSAAPGGAAATPSSVTPAPEVSRASARQLTTAVASAVRTLNDSGIVGQGREVTFSLDRATHLPVVKVIDTSTQEVINQWPPEYALRLAETTQNKGQIEDESILRTDDTFGESA